MYCIRTCTCTGVCGTFGGGGADLLELVDELGEIELDHRLERRVGPVRDLVAHQVLHRLPVPLADARVADHCISRVQYSACAFVQFSTMYDHHNTYVYIKNTRT